MPSPMGVGVAVGVYVGVGSGIGVGVLVGSGIGVGALGATTVGVGVGATYSGKNNLNSVIKSSGTKEYVVLESDPPILKITCFPR